MNKTEVQNFNLDKTLNSGQTFSWFKSGDYYIGSFRDKVVKIKQRDNQLIWQTYPENDNYKFIENYFGLDYNYIDAISEIQNDINISSSLKNYSGLRILKQDFEDTMISFILASNKSIKAIKTSLDKLKRKYAKSVDVDGEKIFLFPSFEYLSSIDENTLKSFGFGYRTKFMQDAANKFTNGNFSNIDKINDYQEVLELLKSVNGIGDKIADCIGAFSLGFNEITPIDRWVDRLMNDLYGVNDLKKYNDKRDWFKARFKNNTTLAGQFLFEYYRDNYAKQK